MSEDIKVYNEKRKRVTLELKALFASSVGKEIIQVLHDEFKVDRIKANDPYTTNYNLGKFDALQTFINLGREK